MQTTIGKAPISKAVRIALTLTLAIGLAVPAALVSALCSPAKAYANGSATITSRGSEAYDGYSTNYFAADGVLAWCSQPNLGTPNGQYPYRSIWGSESFEARVAVIALYLATADCAWSGTSWSHDVYDITYDIAFDASADIPWNVKLQADNIVCMHNIEDSIYCRWHVLISYVLNECWPGYCDPTRGCTNPREWSEQGRAMYEYCCALANGQAYGIVTEAEAQLVKARAENSEIRMTSGGAMQDIVWLNYLGPGYGALELDKDSSNESITAGNDCYNLEGAVYSAFSDAACTNLVASSETNTDGWLRVDSLEPGSYFVRETTAAPGFDLDETVYPVAVKAGETSLVNGGRVFDAPSGSSASLSLKKRSTEDSYAVALGGAQYTMTYFDGLYDTQSEAESSGDPLRTWVFETDGNGIIEVSDESYFAGGDELFRNGGAIFFPRGTYLVKETHAPEGFFLNESVGVYRITDSTSGWTWMSSADPNDATRLDEQPVNAGFELEKVDADLMVCAPQGDATLKGATYSVKNASGRPVCVNGTVFGDGESVFSITTDASGRASCDIDTLPYGTYTVHEVTPSEGYLVSSETKTFSVTQDGVTIDGGSWPERVIHGGLSMTKLDSETLANLPLGGATLKGAEFTVQNASEHNVVVEGATFAPSQDVVTLEADEQGNVATSADFLPFGTYTVRETAAPLGYLPSDEVWTVEIRENGVIHTPQSVDECIDNRVMRSDVSLVKANETTGERMANIPFRITSASTGKVTCSSPT